MISIKQYDKKHLRIVTELAMEFYNKNQYTRGKGSLNPTSFAALMDNSNNDDPDVFAKVFVDDKEGTVVGFFVGLAFDNRLFNLAIAQEQGFYSRKPIGLKKSREVVEAFEEWAADKGADFTVLSALNGTRAGKLFERFGYEASETAYSKALG